MSDESRIVQAMALVRVLSAAIELTAAFLMLRLARIEAAVQINALLGLVGPTILIVVTALGVVGLAEKIPVTKLLLIVAGVVLILTGVRR